MPFEVLSLTPLRPEKRTYRNWRDLRYYVFITSTLFGIKRQQFLDKLPERKRKLESEGWRERELKGISLASGGRQLQQTYLLFPFRLSSLVSSPLIAIMIHMASRLLRNASPWWVMRRQSTTIAYLNCTEQATNPILRHPTHKAFVRSLGVRANNILISVRWAFGAWLVKTQASPTLNGDMLRSLGFSLLSWCIFHRFL